MANAMNINHDAIGQLLSYLTEGLNVEVKSWIDPAQPAGAAKIVKAALALRNRNGGYMVIGFDDKTLQPDVTNRPADIRAAFHLDKIQPLISRYAFDPFEISVAFPERDGAAYPVIIVPEGVRTPVAARGDIIESATGRKLIRHGEIYFRTLSANGTPSTAQARPEDWKEILDICFENREADIGRFLRRHFAGDLSAFMTALATAAGSVKPPAPSLNDRIRTLLDDGDRRFEAALVARPVPNEIPPGLGTWSIALVIDPPCPDHSLDQAFLNVIASSNPQHTGWPPWLDSRTFANHSTAPKVKDRAWETLILSLQGEARHVDFFRIAPQGEFYLLRILQDDLTDKVQPKRFLDPTLVVYRITEVMAVGLAFAKALGWDSESAMLGFGFRWTGLSGRQLGCWSNPELASPASGQAHDDTAETMVEVPLIISPNALAPYVGQAVHELFTLFDGYVMPDATIEYWVRRLVSR
jgi:hypothetical protein